MTKQAIEQYDSISKNYTVLVKTDPQKNYVQYPSALKLLGDISGLRVLDVGCGSGLFDRELARIGALVTAYDVSTEQITNAKKTEQAEPMGIQYSVADPSEFQTTKKFDKAVSVLVLHYAENQEHLEKFFSSTCEALKDDGKFVCILANPKLKRLNVNLYNRCFRRLGNGRMAVDFLDKNQEVSCSAEYSDFSASDYEQAALNGSFRKFEWISLSPTEEGLKEMGDKYWADFKEDCPYVGFIAYKKS